MKTSYAQINAYITQDGSEIRELMHPDSHGNRNQSLAEASLQPGQETRLHRHNTSEELYYIVSGSGLMTMNDDSLRVAPGDTVCIPPGTAHKIRNTGNTALKILCCCAPPYRHADTEILAPQAHPGMKE